MRKIVWRHLPLIPLILIKRFGIAERRFGIRIAPRNDICLHGRTYHINDVAMVKNRITIPTDHVCIKLYDP